MADLDDFFAKKDKKKKTKKGFSKANTEVLAKNLEENDRKEQQAEEKANDVNRVQRLAENAPTISKEADVEEWKEYEENKLDYSNLKIDALKLEGEGEEDEEDIELNEDGEKTKKSKEGGPWSKLVASDSIEDSKEEEEDTSGIINFIFCLINLEPIKEDTPAQVAPAASTAASATKSSYVPPHLRNSAANSAASSPATGVRPGGPRRMKHAPDISSEVYFPSLSAAMGTDDPNRGQGQANSNRGFEEVKSGGSQSYASRGSSNAPKLSLDNKFAALRD
eukprot:10588.XXX_409969_410979_1 [CDS] Oithona nana genome sequencing.